MGKKKEPLVEAEEAPPPYYEATAPPASQIIIYEASDNVAYKDTPMQVTLDKTEPSILSKTRFFRKTFLCLNYYIFWISTLHPDRALYRISTTEIRKNISPFSFISTIYGCLVQ